MVTSIKRDMLNNLRFVDDIVLITDRIDHANLMHATLKLGLNINFAKIQYIANLY